MNLLPIYGPKHTYSRDIITKYQPLEKVYNLVFVLQLQQKQRFLSKFSALSSVKSKRINSDATFFILLATAEMCQVKYFLDIN